MIALTETAAAAVRRLIESEQRQDHGLRVGVTGGGCAGLNYELGLEESPRDDDIVQESKGIKLFCDPKSYLYLNGVEIDYVDSIMQSGFKFNNPNASRSCGCGTSFAAA